MFVYVFIILDVLALDYAHKLYLQSKSDLSSAFGFAFGIENLLFAIPNAELKKILSKNCCFNSK